MGDGNWFRRDRRRTWGGFLARGQAKRKRASLGDRLQRRMTLEPLEDRNMLAVFVVTTLQDMNGGNPAFGGLRWALAQAAATEEADTIVFGDQAFASGLGGEQGPGTISLTGGALQITSQVSILGPGPRKLTVAQTRANQRVFNIDIDGDDIVPVQISGMTITGGNLTGTNDSQRGGAIFNRDALTMNEVVITGNSASRGGGGIFVETGSLRLTRSLVSNNSSNVGGGIMTGTDDDDDTPSTFIQDSTITGNRAFGGGKDEYPVGYGAGVFNRNGVLRVLRSTIVYNDAGESGKGGGIGSWGNQPPAPDEMDPPPPTVFTFISSSIVFGNTADDVSVVGPPTDDDPPQDLLPSVTSQGYNIFGVLEARVVPVQNDLPANTDPELMELGDYGGSTDVFMISDTSPALDAGTPMATEMEHEQRGRHFTRAFDYTQTGTPRADVGAVERQQGNFVVDELFDEQATEGQTSKLFQIVDVTLGTVTVFTYDTEGDFTIREALSFAQKNLEPAVITFSESLRNREYENDPHATPSPATINLRLGVLRINTPTVIQGPSTFILEIDVTQADPTPNNNAGDGSRVFLIDDGDATTDIRVEISDLTIMGGEINDALGGAGMLTREDVLLQNVTFKDNYTKFNGGAIVVKGGTLTVSGTTFKNNEAAINGGAVYVDNPTGKTVTFTNTTFSGNNASARGGAIFVNNGATVVEYSTVTLNSAGTTRGSGLWTTNTADAKITIRGSIVAGNQLNDVEFAPSATAKIISDGYNFVGAGNALANFNKPGDITGNTNPMLGPLMITGGQTETHRPLTGSPVIDKGNPAFAGTPAFDQRGPNFVRVFDGDLNGTARIDIGAYELQGSTFIVSTAVDELDGNYSSGDLSLREAIKLANENPLFDRIEFDPALVLLSPVFAIGATLGLNDSADMRITTSMEIIGPGSGLLALNGAGNSHALYPLAGPQRLFTIGDGSAATTINVKITGLEVRNFTTSGFGGAISSTENLTLEDLVFVNNSTLIYDPLLTGLVTGGLHGGAIYQDGASLTVNSSILSGNKTNDPSSDGGSLFAQNAQVTLYYTTFAGNGTLKGSSRGGAIALKNSTLSADQVTITGNSTTAGLADGGGVFLDNTPATFVESALANNFTLGSNARGGGIAVVGAGSVVSLDKNTVLSLNRTTGTGAMGGGAFVGGGTLEINNSNVTLNSTSGMNASGGGVAIGSGGTLRMTGAHVQLNTTAGSTAHGGGVAVLGGAATIRDSLLSGNKAQNGNAKGGGLYSDTAMSGSSITMLVNSTVSGNMAGLRGGGVFNADGRTTILHSTITNNSVPFFNAGSGVGSQGNSVTQTTVGSSIIAGNVGTTGAIPAATDVDVIDAPFTNSFTSSGYNVVGIGNALAKFNGLGDKTSITAPGLGPLANNGGPTFTHLPLAGSVAINNGNPSFSANAFTPPMTTDQRGTGFARVLGGRIDSGAVESNLSPYTADFDIDGRVTGTDFLMWQRGNGINSGATKAQGDANGDGRVNGLDLTAWRSQFGAGSAEAAALPAAEGGGGSGEAMLAAAVMAPAALGAASGGDSAPVASNSARRGAAIDAASLAGAGVPGATPHGRPASRPAQRHALRDAALDFAHAHRGARDALAALADDEAAPRRSHDGGDSGDACEDLSGEDAVFALLGAGLLT
jgi:predicted outer membrane repeat protein